MAVNLEKKKKKKHEAYFTAKTYKPKTFDPIKCKIEAKVMRTKVHLYVLIYHY